MDKTLRFFASGQRKDVSTLTENEVNKKDMTAAANGFQDMTANSGRHIQNNADDKKRKDSDNFFYILWHS